MKIIGVIIVVLLSIITIELVFNKSDEPKINITESEYTELSVANCSVDNNESYCRCVYDNLLEEYSLEEVMEMDTAVLRQGINYEFTDKQTEIIRMCL